MPQHGLIRYVPQYGLFRYGLKKYGRYILGTSDEFAIGEYVRYRMRILEKSGYKTEYVQMANEWLTLSVPEGTPIRIRANDGEWVRLQTEEIKDKNAYRVRIRSVDSKGNATEWVYGERGDLKEI